MIPDRPGEGGAEEVRERRRRTTKPKERGKAEVEPTWAEGSAETKGGD